MPEAILGISAFYHDSAAAILVDGDIIAAAQEERFSRKKHDYSFPHQAVAYVLEEAGLGMEDLTAVAFYDKPYLKFERLLVTYHAYVPKGLRSFLSAMPVWIKEKLFMKKMLREELAKFGANKLPLHFPEHHLSHAASAFYPSPFEKAAILTLDGVGEWATTSIGYGEGNEIQVLKELHFPHSLGLLYSAFTYYTGFKVNSGEYKLMGLAPYGNPDSERLQQIKDSIYRELIDVREDGSMLLNMSYFNYATGLRMTVDEKWEKLFGFPRREAETELSQVYMDMALAIQQVTEEIVLKLATTAQQLTGAKQLVMAGGVALNCVANGKLLDADLFEDIWIQPAAGDAGGALGAAYASWHIWKEQPRRITVGKDAMQGSLLGPAYSDKEIEKTIRKFDAPVSRYADFEELAQVTAQKLADEKVVGWFQGRMEYGPRALGARSILGDARSAEMQRKMNLKIKYRESFRPFAPSVLAEDAPTYFELDRESPYMLLVKPVQPHRWNPEPDNYHQLPLKERLYHQRSDIPAITHIDYSARIQTVNGVYNPRYWQLIQAFKALTGYSLVVNTSFNVRGEPIVCTPEDAFRCFMRTEMDYLVMGNCLFDKRAQKPSEATDNWQEEFALD
ncbi:MAG: carbamoyltransferase [Bacteroidota bacterium]